MKSDQAGHREEMTLERHISSKSFHAQASLVRGTVFVTVDKQNQMKQ